MMCYRGDKVTKAFDELSEIIDDSFDDIVTQYGYYKGRTKKCACCGESTGNRIDLYLCDRHLSKYGDIVKHE